jgi:cytosine/adenosine deaminase-related metal-dependent hydrolase
MPQNHSVSRRNFLTGAGAAAGAGLAGFSLFDAKPAAATGFPGSPPPGSGLPGRRYVIRNGYVMTMETPEKNFVKGDVLVEGKKILAVGPNLQVGFIPEIDARGKVVMPGFIDTHHHLFETALRSFLSNGVLINDGSGSVASDRTYFEYILLTFAPVYRPEDVYISELFGSLAQLDNGVTTVFDVSQIHHSPQHSDAAIKALFDSERRAVFGYFESAGNAVLGTNPDNQYPQDATRIRNTYFSSNDKLVTMIMGGEVYLGDPTTVASWTLGRELGLQIAAHILSPFGIRSTLDRLTNGTFPNGIQVGSDNLFIHMTGMSDPAWAKVRDVGAQVSLAFPIEMNMRHGIPPIHKMQSLGMEPSLSTDVEVTMTADFFTQMRSAMTMQRMVVNQEILNSGDFTTFVGGVAPGSAWPPPPPDTLPLLNVKDVLRYATINGAKALRLDSKVGTLTPGKEADIILLDGNHINVFPINNVPGAVVSLMERSNVETVIVAGKVRKWKGQLLDVDLPRLRTRLEASRDYLFKTASFFGTPIQQELFR